MLNLISSIHELENKKQKIIEQCRQDVEEIDKAIEIVKKMNEACLDCRGKGWRLREMACAEDDRPNPEDPNDRIKCRSCNGTGFRVYHNKEGVLTSAKDHNELFG